MEIAAKYDGYVRRMLDEIARFKESESQLIPADLDYRAVPGLSTEIRERLHAVRCRPCHPLGHEIEPDDGLDAQVLGDAGAHLADRPEGG